MHHGMSWAMGAGGGGGMIWANRSLVGQPPMLSLSPGNHLKVKLNLK